MIPTYTNLTVRSASDLLADLRACRQFRHVSDDQLRSVVHFFFGDVENPLLENRRMPGTGRFFAWVQEAFEEAVSIHGHSCDICDEVTEVPEDRWHYSAERMLENLDGKTKLCLCRVCSGRFQNFCQKMFHREARTNWTRELEQMMLAFIASELGREARRVIAGKPARRRRNECTATGENRTDRAPIEGRSDSPGSISLGEHQPKHSAAV